MFEMYQGIASLNLSFLCGRPVALQGREEAGLPRELVHNHYDALLVYGEAMGNKGGPSSVVVWTTDIRRATHGKAVGSRMPDGN